MSGARPRRSSVAVHRVVNGFVITDDNRYGDRLMPETWVAANLQQVQDLLLKIIGRPDDPGEGNA